jgi:hypothetical protein
MTVPALTGRATWMGDFPWTPHFAARQTLTDALFAGRLAPQHARATVRSIPAAYLLAPCGRRLDVARVLGGLVRNERRFGCVAVYELTSAG